MLTSSHRENFKLLETKYRTNFCFYGGGWCTGGWAKEAPLRVHVWPVPTVCCWCGWGSAKIAKREEGAFLCSVYCTDEDHSQPLDIYSLENIAITLKRHTVAAKGPGDTCTGTSITSM